MSRAILSEGAAPSTPATATVAMYAKTDGRMYSKDDAGLEYLLSGGLAGWKSVKEYGATGDGSTDDRSALNSAWTATVNGGTLYVPPGTYACSDTVNWTDKTNITVWCDAGAIFTDKAVSFSGKVLMTLSGDSSCKFYNLNINCRNATTRPVAGLMLSRNSGETAGGQNSLYGAIVQGIYSGASVYNHAAETFVCFDCYFQSETVKPTYLDAQTDILSVSGRTAQSNTRKTFYHCFFMNYGTNAGGVAVTINTAGSEYAFRDCYSYLGCTNGTAFRIQGNSSMVGLNIDGHRTEGVASTGSRFVYCTQNASVDALRVKDVAWTVSNAAYFIETGCDTIRSELWNNQGGHVGQMLHVLNGGQVRFSHIYCDSQSGPIQVDNGGTMQSNVIYTSVAGYPINGAGDYNIAAFQDNMVVSTAPGAGVRLYATAHSQKFNQFTDTDTTPSVAAFELWKCNSSVNTSITMFDDPLPGQRISVVCSTGNTTFVHDATKIRLAGGINYTPTANSLINFVYDDLQTHWRETGRVVA